MVTTELFLKGWLKQVLEMFLKIEGIFFKEVDRFLTSKVV